MLFLLFLPQLFCIARGCGEIDNFRLSKDVYPTHYDLTLTEDLENLNFSGNVVIHVILKVNSKHIKLHSKNLNVTSAKFTSDNANITYGAQVNYCESEETVSFEFESQIVGSGKLEITYDGLISDQKIAGLYAFKNKNNGVERYSTAMHFQPTAARRVYPCFDEPNLKATFSIAVIAPKNRTVVSNMPAVKAVSVSETMTKTEFAKTPKMSSYLVCVVVGDFEFVEQKSIDGQADIRVYTPVGKREQGSFALGVARRCVDFLQKYLGVKYTLPKLDIIAVKDHFAPGGMENWGIILQKEKSTLFDVNKSPTSQRQIIAALLAHEISHQWLGNIVTTDWWDDMWLNEGFARFFECFLIENLFKEWKYSGSCLESHVSGALYDDSFESNNPVVLPNVNQSEMDVVFSPTIYQKGSSIVKMLRNWIGDKAFKRSMNQFLREKEFSNAVTDDILRIFDKNKQQPVSTLLKTWLYQNGYPVIKVQSDVTTSELTKTKHSSQCVGLKQEKFSLSGQGKDEKLWQIPIIYTDSIKKRNKSLWMKTESLNCISKSVSDLNVGSFGFYRVQYTEEQYNELFSKVKNGMIEPEQRFSLQNDYFAFAVAGIQSTVDYMKYLQYFTGEEELFIWRSIESSLNKIKTLTGVGNCSKEMNAFIRKMFGKINAKLSIKQEDDLTTILRALVYRRLGLSGDETIIKDARQRFHRYCNGESIDSNYRAAVFDIVASNAEDNEYDELFDLLKNSDDGGERNEIATSLGLARNAHQLQKALNFSLSTHVGTSESATIIKSVAASAMGTDLAWNVFMRNVETFRYRFENSPNAIVGAIAFSVKSPQKLNEIEAFAKRQKFNGMNRTLRMAYESLDVYKTWIERDAQQVCSFLLKSA